MGTPLYAGTTQSSHNMDAMLESLSREQLAQLGREYMLASQFNSRTGYAALRINHGDAAYKEIAIANWLGASPVYTRRMQRAMGFAGGTDVATIFKGLQLECGFTHQYFDVHFEVQGPDEGRFWLKSCGPLLETEPRGEDAVRVMCHDIEDPTFDATAIATNPRARMRPVHRPPRVPADRSPHCEWRVFIDHGADALGEPEQSQAMAATALARVAIPRPAAAEPGGMDYYNGPVHEQLHLERLSHPALAVVCKEIAVQNHLLVLAMMQAIAERYGEAAARAVAEFQMTGSAWVMSDRLSQWLGHDQGGIDAIIDVLAVHPAFQPREYHAIEVKKLDQQRATLRLLPCPAMEEIPALGWFARLLEGADTGLEGLVKGVDPRACIKALEGEGHAWEITLDSSGEPGEAPLPVQIAKGTVLYQTRLENHLPLLQLAE